MAKKRARRTPGGIPERDWRAAQRIGRKKGVDPLLLVAIGKHETNWGKLGDGRNGNVLGVGSYDSGSSYKWSGVHNQLVKGADLLKSWGVHSLKDVKRGKAGKWATDPNWEAGIANMYSQISKGYSSKDLMAGGKAKPKPAQSVTYQTTPGVDNSEARKQVAYSALSQSNPFALSKLIGVKGQMDALADVAPTSTKVVRTGAPVATPQGGGRGASPLRSPDAGNSLQRMLRVADAQASKKLPYLWGGGHGSTAKVGQAVDCSGYVSMILGLRSPLVSGDLARWGEAGHGRWVTVYADAGHTLIKIRDPKTNKARWYATSSQNAGGGAGRIKPPPASYLGRFTKRHPKGL